MFAGVGYRDEYVLRDYIKLMSPLAYGNDGRILFYDGINDDCPKTDVTGTVFRKSPTDSKYCVLFKTYRDLFVICSHNLLDSPLRGHGFRML